MQNPKKKDNINRKKVNRKNLTDREGRKNHFQKKKVIKNVKKNACGVIYCRMQIMVSVHYK